MTVDANEFFRQATVRICSSLDIEIALQRMQQYVRQFIPARNMALGLIDSRKNVLRNVAGSISETAPDQRREVSLPESSEMRAKWIRRHVELDAFLVVNRLESEDPDLHALMSHLGMDTDISLIMIRLELEGNRIGGLWVSTPGDRKSVV